MREIRSSEPASLDLTLDGIRALSEAVMTAGGRHGTPFGTYVFSAHEPGAALARHVERAVFEESFGSTPDQLATDFAAYEDASLFFCVIDHERQLPVGMVRIIVPGPAGQKSLDDIAAEWGQDVPGVLARTGLALDPGRAWDIATLAVAPGYRNRVVSQALHQAIGVGTMACGVDWYVSVLDTRVLRLLQAQLARVFRLYEGVEPAMYAGSVSVPVWSDLVAYRRRLQAQDRALYETIFEGRHLEVVVSLFGRDDVRAAAGALGSSPRAARVQAVSGRTAA
jgi:hypothetical protein